MSANNNSWASTSSRAPVVPRSTSVEYETAAPAIASGQRNKKLAAPPNKLLRPPVSSQNRKPPSKSHLVPDSEGEEDRNVRGKSPLEVGMNIAKQAIGAAAFYVRQRSHEPENSSRDQDQSAENLPANGRVDGNDSSYSYREEESAFLASKRAAKKGRISVDNKAYKPTQSDDEYSEYSSDDNKPSKRRKSTKGGHGGPLTSLPVVGNSKKRRRYKKPTAGSSRSGPDGGQEEYLSESEEEEDPADPVCCLLFIFLFSYSLCRKVSIYGASGIYGTSIKPTCIQSRLCLSFISGTSRSNSGCFHGSGLGFYSRNT